jgi:hypothetical protein
VAAKVGSQNDIEIALVSPFLLALDRALRDKGCLGWWRNSGYPFLFL